MKNADTKMGLLMGASLSFILSLTGMLSANAFTLPSFLISFLIGFLISTIIMKIIPIRRISDSFTKGMERGSLKQRLADAFVSDLLMSPLMTLLMVYIAYRQAVSHGAKIPFGPMLLRSEIVSFIVAFLAIFLLSPIFIKKSQ